MEFLSLQPVHTEGFPLLQALQFGSVLVQHALFVKSTKPLLLQEVHVPAFGDKQSLQNGMAEVQQRLPFLLGNFPESQDEHLSLVVAQSVHDVIEFVQQ